MTFKCYGVTEKSLSIRYFLTDFTMSKDLKISHFSYKKNRHGKIIQTSSEGGNNWCENGNRLNKH